MDLLHAFILALVQGITEFLPISSSAHLILLPYLAGWVDQGLIYDLAAHLGTLAAVIIYFRRDLRRIIAGGWQSLHGHADSDDGRMFWYLIVGSIPVAIFGLTLYGLVADEFRSPLLIAIMNLIFALLLWWADKSGRLTRGLSAINMRDALLVGLAQALALIPGVSRSGVTITTALLLDLDRQAAARFSFLLSIPATLMAASYGVYRLLFLPAQGDVVTFCVVAGLSFVGALAAIHVFLRFLDRFGMMPYVIYRLLLGVLLLAIFI